jgi:hypothetical protein
MENPLVTLSPCSSNMSLQTKVELELEADPLHRAKVFMVWDQREQWHNKMATHSHYYNRVPCPSCAREWVEHYDQYCTRDEQLREIAKKERNYGQNL